MNPTCFFAFGGVVASCVSSTTSGTSSSVSSKRSSAGTCERAMMIFSGRLKSRRRASRSQALPHLRLGGARRARGPNDRTNAAGLRALHGLRLLQRAAVRRHPRLALSSLSRHGYERQSRAIVTRESSLCAPAWLIRVGARVLTPSPTFFLTRCTQMTAPPRRSSKCTDKDVSAVFLIARELWSEL